MTELESKVNQAISELTILVASSKSKFTDNEMYTRIWAVINHLEAALKESTLQVDGLNKNPKPHKEACEGKDMMDRLINQAKFKELINQMYETYVAKNHDYGNSFDKSLDKFGLVASVVRIGDKMNRIESLQGKANMVPESIRDTLLDMANYAIMTVMWMDKSR